MILHLDIETYSSEDLKTAGRYRYAEAIDFEILMIAYAFEEGPVAIVSLAQGETLPSSFVRALKDPTVEKHAHNAAFERECFKQYGYDIPADQWHCSAIKAAYCGLPLSLAGVSQALDLQEFGKSSEGKALINYFCMPCKPTKVNGGRTRNLPEHNPEKWEAFKKYCKQDVVAERAVVKALSAYTIPDFERKNYLLDQKINDLGVLVDLDFVKKAVKIDTIERAGVMAEMQKLTGLSNPNSDAQVKGWLFDEFRMEVKSLKAELVPDIIADAESVDSSGRAARALELRKLLGKTSTSKYTAMVNGVCFDGRVRGMFQFYGARTGRWAGRLVQLHNLPQNHIEDLKGARDDVNKGDHNYLSQKYEDVPTLLSELIRTALVARGSQTFAVADFSAIEARVIAWLAGETWRLRVFYGHGKIYEASAAMMFGVDIETVTKGSDLRAKGKIAELALGYQGAKGALAKMGGEKMGLSEGDMEGIVKKWRRANPAIVSLWHDIEAAAKRAVKTKKIFRFKNLSFGYDGHVLIVGLPSGRELFYQSPGFGLNKWNQESLYYWGQDSQTKQWVKLDTYGGKLVENIVQAIARDLLALTMIRLDNMGYKICMHVHDEVVCEVDPLDAEDDLKIMCRTMREATTWSINLPLGAEGYVTEFYKKD